MQVEPFNVNLLIKSIRRTNKAHIVRVQEPYIKSDMKTTSERKASSEIWGK